MSGNSAEFGDDPLPVGSYSELLFGDETDGYFDFTCKYSPDDNTQKMLCFGDSEKQCNVKASVKNDMKTGQESGPAACMDNKPISKRKRNGPGGIEKSESQSGAPTGIQKNREKSKSDNSTVSGHAKKVVRKEKLGDRITALQQLVSPFGKTDTASVLHEALGYIRFLHDQVQVLCSPYLQRWSTSLEVPRRPDDDVSKESEGRKSDLRSRGLCLVPVDLTLQVADSNGADLWSSGAMVNTISTS